MKKVIIIGCPGSGKSTFARKLHQITKLPLYYLDMLYHKKDKTVYTKQEFDEKLATLLEKDSWIIDGNYNRTLSRRINNCDTIFWLDYPLHVCLKGVKNRQNKPREDMPWIETEPDEEFIQYIKNFENQNKPIIMDCLANAVDKNIYIFSSRDEADEFLNSLRKR